MEKAIEQGNAMAANNLGFCYLNGFGVEKDKEKAKYYFQKSAEMGYELAKKNLKFIK
ncbi:tetratricopeptide repeat protein [Prevotella disiens]|uniref:tetratricopeptide repeat protein n=1 Tax=Prevotella disiens TaxID=28130 RepID=UPI00336A59D5